MLHPWKTIFNITFDTDKSLVIQIADSIRNEITKGRLAAGTALPGSRILSEDIGVNRKTVVFAYETLIAEGWLESRSKAGTFVASNLPVLSVKKKNASPYQANFRFRKVPYSVLTDMPAGRNRIVFNEGAPDTRLAPLVEISRAYRRVFQQKGRWGLLGYGSEKGDEKLREALCLMLSRDRGIHLSKDNICITRGSQMALYLAIRILVSPQDTVVMELPGYPAVAKLFEEAGARIQAAKVDRDGLDTDYLEKLCQRHPIKVLYTTPHHQFPTTVTMKAARRLHLLELSLKYGFAIIEDDYDHEYHFGAGNNLALASKEMAANVIYISSLSKLIAPAVRIGYIAGPPLFMQSLINFRVHIDRQGDRIMERALGDLIVDGTLKKHARKALSIYDERRKNFDQLLRHYFGTSVTFEIPEGGLAFWIQLEKEVDWEQFIQKLLDKNVQIVPPQSYYWKGKASRHVRLGYGSLNLTEIEEGVKQMARIYLGK